LVMGEGAPVVLLHAFPSCHEMWWPVALELRRRYRVVLPDLRAHGLSSPGDGAATMEKHAQDIDAICRNEKISKAVFVGTSIGGYILFEFWRRSRERVSGLILCNTRATADTEEARAGRLRSIADIEKRGPGPFLDESTEKLVGEATRKNRPDIMAAARRTMRHSTVGGLSAALRGLAERPDSVPTLASIDVPTLIVASDEDTTPFSEATLMQQKIKASQLVKLTGAGHYSVFEKAEEAAKVMRKFLDALPT